MADRAKAAALIRALAAMFRALERRPIPPDICATVDQLEENAGQRSQAKPAKKPAP